MFREMKEVIDLWARIEMNKKSNMEILKIKKIQSMKLNDWFKINIYLEGISKLENKSKEINYTPVQCGLWISVVLPIVTKLRTDQYRN